MNGAAPVRSRWPAVLALSAAAAFLILSAGRLMFGVFMFYDDEGYVLLAFRKFSEHGGLYREVFSQYGPFPFVFHWVLHLCGLPPTHAGGRVITLVLWVFVALAFAWLAARASRSITATLATLAGSFACLFVMTSEPSHPGGLIAALVATMAAGGWFLLREGRWTAWGLLSGATIAALALTKINVGAFAAFAALAWWALHQDRPRSRPLLLGALFAGCMLLAPLLTRAMLTEEWVATLTRVWTSSALAVVLVLARKASPCPGGKAILPALLGGTMVAAVVVAVPLTRGSDINDVLDGILLGPLRNAVRYSNAYGWWSGINWVAAVSLAGAAAATFAPEGARRKVDITVATLRLLAAAALATTLAWPPVFMGAFKVYGFVLPFLWLFAWPLGREEAAAARAHAWLVLLLLGQCLHVYPVAGSQVAWACVLAVPVAAIGATEAAAHLGLGLRPGIRRATGLAIAATFLFTAATAALGLDAEARRRTHRPLVGLPGCGPLRQPPETASLLRVMTLNAVAHTDVLFSEPGMFSFNLWSGVPTPTSSNVTHWFSLLDAKRQDEIAQSLAAHPRAGVIIDRGHIAFLRSRDLAPSGNLHNFIDREFEPAFRAANLEFRVRRGRVIRPFLLAELLTLAESAGEGERHLIRIPLLLPTGNPVAAVEVAPGHPGAIRLDGSTTRVEITPLSPRGDPAGPAVPAQWPIATSGPALLSLYFSSPDPSRLPREATLLLKNAAGAEEGLARLAP